MAYKVASPVVQSQALPPASSSDAAIRRTQEQDESMRSKTEDRTPSLRRTLVSGDPPAIPSFNFGEHEDTVAGGRQSRQSGSSLGASSVGHSRTPSRETPDLRGNRNQGDAMPETQEIPLHQLNISDGPYHRHSHAADMEVADLQNDPGPTIYSKYQLESDQLPTPPPHAFSPGDNVYSHGPESGRSSRSNNSDPRSAFNFGIDPPLQLPGTTLTRPGSAYTLGSELNVRGRTNSPRLGVGGGSPSPNGSSGHNLSTSRRSPDIRPTSYIDLLNLPYNQQIAPAANLGNSLLRNAVGQNASLLDTKKTLDMYRANVKTQDSAVQYEFAVYMVQVAREIMASDPSIDNAGLAPMELLREARQILQRIADRSYPFAQYYLADGYASGLFNKDKPDYDRAFPLFIAASKHGHAESGYRAALCYEFGWGCRKDYAKAVQFYRAAASKNHPGAAYRMGKACLTGDMGLQNRYREGVKWIKRATESADHQYRDAPYELGLLHESGFGDDIFKDEIYAVQLFTQAAELGHPEAALKLGEAYEHGYLRCPKDAALSVHYYNCAAQADIPEAMMNLCAWYMVGAEPVLEKDENEAYEWAKRAADHG
jgi:TPR repeat protein